MKKIIFFDLDNTIYSTKTKKIPSQTEALIKKLASMPNVEIGLATGRGPSKIHMLDHLIDLFSYRVFINGALAYRRDQLIYNNPLKTAVIEKVLKQADGMDVSVGFVAKDDEYINRSNEDVDYGMKDFSEITPIIDETVYLRKPIYQLWLFAKNFDSIIQIAKESGLIYYPWHSGGTDLVDKGTNKAAAIAKVLENETNYQLITVGDGHNDVKMIEMADIGIAMENSKFETLKEKADYIAPHVESNQLYDFFKQINIID